MALPRVLIIAPTFFHFGFGVTHAFHHAGFEVCSATYDTPVDPYDFLRKLAFKFARDKEGYRLKRREARQQHFIDIFDDFAPDIVFIMNGEILLPKTLDYFRSKAKVALWCFDSVKHIPIIEGHIDHVDRFYCYDRGDIEYYAAQGKTALFLPQAAYMGPVFYRPLEGVKKDIDILFVGDLYHSPRRQQFIRGVVEAFPDRKIKVVGIYKPWYKNPFKALLRERRDIYTNRNVEPEEVNRLYNRARVVLNIHNEQQSDGANPKVFEICASGAYQVCDANPYIRQLFPDGSVGLYDTEEQMHALIREALEHDMTEKAAVAQAIVAQRHTFGNRVESVLKDLNQ